jgi:hypothetical protein
MRLAGSAMSSAYVEVDNTCFYRLHSIREAVPPG